MSMTVGVIGLGNMGRGIARNIAKGGHDLLAWDVSEDARAPFAELGRIADPAAMAAEADVVIFVVPGSPEIDAILPDMLAAANDRLILWDFTTSDPVYTKRLAARAAEAGVPYMDAGMTGGGAMGADEGTMTLMIGGDAEVLKRSLPVLEVCAGELIHLGPSGAGHTMKVVHNLITHTNFLATSEAGKLAEAAGIELKDMIRVFNAGNARSFISERRFPDHILSETWDGRSRIYNLRKDVGMAVALSKELGSPMRLGHQTLAWLEAAVKAGMEEQDFTRLYPALDTLAGPEAAQTPVLWGRASSSNVQKVMWALAEVGQPYERIDAGGKYGRTDSEEFGAMNPVRRVPVWQEGDLTMWESNAILRHLGAGPAAALWPEDPAERAVADQWMDFSATTLTPPFIGVFWQVVRTPAAERSEAAIAKHLAALDAALDILEARLATVPYLAGARFTLADIPAGTAMFRYHDIDIPRRPRPALEDWYARLQERPAYRDTVVTSYEELRAA